MSAFAFLHLSRLPARTVRLPLSINAPAAARPAAPLTVGVSAAAPKERRLSDEELAAIWSATEFETPVNATIRLMILTGRRWREVAELAWDELSADLTLWTLPAERAEDGETHVVPLCWRAVAVIGAARRDLANRYVFADRRGKLTGFAKAKAALDAESGVVGWRVEDLAHTVVGSLTRLGDGAADASREDGGHSRSALFAWGEHVGDVTAKGSRAPGLIPAALRRLFRAPLESTPFSAC